VRNHFRQKPRRKKRNQDSRGRFKGKGSEGQLDFIKAIGGKGARRWGANKVAREKRKKGEWG